MKTKGNIALRLENQDVLSTVENYKLTRGDDDYKPFNVFYCSNHVGSYSTEEKASEHIKFLISRGNKWIQKYI